MATRQKFHIRNWREYNQALIQRGSLTVWFDNRSLKLWHQTKKTGRRGHPYHYSDTAIFCALTLRAVYHLSLRATTGLLRSLIKLLHKNIDCPDYTVLCRRQKKMGIPVPHHVKVGEPLHIVVDATGVKVYGEGEWKVRQHGWCKRRHWRKLHIALDADRQIIKSAVITTENVHDGEVLGNLLSQIKSSIADVTGDGAYDSHRNHALIKARGAMAVIPPRCGAVIRRHGNCTGPPWPRDTILRSIRKSGQKKWKEVSHYHRRNLAETAIFRLKTLFGHALRDRIFISQATELLIRCVTLNKMTRLGMPDSFAVA